MADLRLVNQDVVTLAGALWTFLTREYSADLHVRDGRQVPMPTPGQFLEPRERQRNAAAEVFVQQGEGTDVVTHSGEMTIRAFVANRFVPEFVALKRSSSRAFYRSILKHILRPEEVDRLFSFRRNVSPERLKAVPGWPYLSNAKLSEVHPEDIQCLTSAALARGYSLHTVRHIRNVVNAIFSYAR